MGEIIILGLRNQYIVICKYGQKYKNMTSSKCIRTRHHMRRFLCIYLILKIHPNKGQKTGTGAVGKKKKYGRICRGALLTVDTLMNFYW